MNAESGQGKELCIAVAGAAGRMGGLIAEAVAEAGDLTLAAIFEGAGHPALGQAATAGLSLAELDPARLQQCDALIEFTRAGAPGEIAAAAAAAGCALVSGTTGLDAAEESAIAEAANVIPVVRARNMSLGVALLAELTEQAARALGEVFDIEISELHHRSKRDAPSGTARLLGEAAAAGRGCELGELEDAPRYGVDSPRRAGGIGFAALRGGSAAGDHTVLFLGDGERLELTHRAESRALFVRGALVAARWVAGRPAGLYSMRDVLDL